MQKEAKEKHFVKRPKYPGGSKAMARFIRANLKYPTQALEHRIEGTVLVRYDIDYRGRVVQTKIKSSLGYGCDEEAERVVRMFRFDVPKMPKKLRVLFHKTAKIPFKLPKAKRAKIAYTYTTTSKQSQGDDNATRGYHYSIRLPD